MLGEFAVSLVLIIDVDMRRITLVDSKSVMMIIFVWKVLKFGEDAMKILL